MKKKFISLLCAVSLLFSAMLSVSSLTAFAGAPPYVPIYELILIDRNDALSVTSQTLTIMPPSVIREPYSQYSPNMPDRLSTVYEIENRAESVNSRLAVLHFGNVFDDLSSYNFEANGAVLSPVVYYSNLNQFANLDDYSAVLDASFREPVLYDDSLCGTLYEFTGAPMSPISFTLAKNQKIIHSANSVQSMNGVNINTSGTLASSSGELSVFVTSGDLNYSCGGDVEVESTVITYNDFLAETDFPLSEGSALTLFLFASNNFSKFINGGSDMLSLGDLFNLPSCMVLVYEVEFLVGANVVSLARPVKFTYDYGMEPPVFALHIKTAPLKTWAEIRTTNIEITTPPDLPYIIDDDLCFEKIAENSYKYSGDISSLDEYFILFCSAESSIIKSPNSPSRPWWVWTLFVIGSAALVVLIVSVASIIRDKRKRI